MKRLLPVSCLLFAFCNFLWGQNDTDSQLQQAFGLEQNGQIQEALKILLPLANSQGITSPEAGKIWISLGSAYQDESDFANARACYEKAVVIFRDEPQAKAEY